MMITKRCRAGVILHAASSIIAYVVLALNAASFANETTWNFAGVLRQYNDVTNQTLTTTAPPELAAVGLVPGAILSARLTYDVNAPDVDPDSGRGQYSPITSAQMHIGELDLQFDPSINVIVIGTGAPSTAVMGMTSGFGLGDSHGLNIVLGGLELTDASGNQFPTDALLSQAPSLSSVDPFDPSNPPFGTRGLMGISTSSTSWIVQFELTDLHSVPEPSAFMVLATGVAGFIPRRRPNSQDRS